MAREPDAGEGLPTVPARPQTGPADPMSPGGQPPPPGEGRATWEETAPPQGLDTGADGRAGEAAPPGHRPSRLRRSRTDRVVGGVCGGLGAYLGVDPVWLRIAFVALTFGGGSGVLLYIVAWIAMPEAEPGDVDYERPAVRNSSGQAAVLIGGGLIILGFVLLLEQIAPRFADVVWPILLVLVGVGVLLGLTRRDDRGGEAR